jgi:hypothetical protein
MIERKKFENEELKFCAVYNVRELFENKWRGIESVENGKNKVSR